MSIARTAAPGTRPERSSAAHVVEISPALRPVSQGASSAHTGLRLRRRSPALHVAPRTRPTPSHAPNVGAPSPAPPAAGPRRRAPPAAKLPLIGLVIGGVVLCVVAVLALFLLTRTEDLQGQVQGVEWTRSIAVEALGPVQLEDWRDELPADAQAETCSLKFRSTSDEPEPIAPEACGTPSPPDTGGGEG